MAHSCAGILLMRIVAVAIAVTHGALCQCLELFPTTQDKSLRTLLLLLFLLQLAVDCKGCNGSSSCDYCKIMPRRGPKCTCTQAGARALGMHLDPSARAGTGMHLR